MAKRAVAVGLDGAAWHLVDPLIEAGVMPRLGALRARGASGTLQSTVPPVTPPAWTSAVTGVNPGRHGIFGFHAGNAQDKAPRLMHSGEVRAPCVWEIANSQGRRVGVFNLPLSFPPQPLEGWMVAGFLTPGLGEHVKGFVYPSHMEARLRQWQPDYVIEIETNQERDWRDAALAERALEALRHRRVALEGLLREDPPDIVFAVLETPDRLQHLYYRYMDPNDPKYDTDAGRRIRPAIERCFRAMDDIAGLLEDHAGSDGAVIVCSDHGFTAWDVSVHTNTLLQRWGHLHLKRQGRLMQSGLVRKAVPLAWRIVPTKLRRRAKRQTFSVIDWERTEAFASVYYQQGVWVNLAGREPFGIVPASRLESVKDEIAEGFRSLRGPDGEPVTDRVWRSEEAYQGDARKGAPDLMVAMRDHRFLLDDEVFHREPFTDHRRYPRGCHHPDGIVVIAGEGSRPGASVTGSVMDVTPTLLYMAGLHVPEELDGRVLTEAFSDEHLERAPIRTVPPLPPGHREERSPYSAREAALIEESLRDLGYL
jgi:predicted AlkP superfamily phosphohydrolase/phosphomutase